MKEIITIKRLTQIGVSTLLLNMIFHLFSIERLIYLFDFSPVMTIFTSCSLLCIYLAINSKDQGRNQIFLCSAILIQMASMTQFFLENQPSSSFLLSSSISTSTLVFITVLFLALVRREKTKSNIKSALGPALFFISICLMFSYITESMFLLGISDVNLGIGLSLYTLFSFLIISTLISKKYTRLVSLDLVQVYVSHHKSIIFLVLYSLSNFLLVYCTSENKIFISVGIQIVFLTFSFFLYIRPFQMSKNRVVTLCAWSKSVKAKEETWLNQEEMFKTMGMKVSHGISPEEMAKFNASRSNS